MNIPKQPKIYHIVHVDGLRSNIEEGYLWNDAETVRRAVSGTAIGMKSIKKRRLNELSLTQTSWKRFR